MTRFVVDAGAVLYLASEGSKSRAITSSSHHPLAIPDAVSAARGRPPRRASRGRRPRPPRARLADADPAPRRCRTPASGVGGSGAHGMAETYTAEYVALTQLQAEAFVTLDAELARSVERGRRDSVDRRAALATSRPAIGLRRQVGCRPRHGSHRTGHPGSRSRASRPDRGRRACAP